MKVASCFQISDIYAEIVNVKLSPERRTKEKSTHHVKFRGGLAGAVWHPTLLLNLSFQQLAQSGFKALKKIYSLPEHP